MVNGVVIACAGVQLAERTKKEGVSALFPVFQRDKSLEPFCS